jgi:hypothetical protein
MFVSHDGADLAVPGGEAGSPEIGRPKIIAVRELDGLASALRVNIREELEPYGRALLSITGPPAPDVLPVGTEACLAERLLQPGGFDRTSADLQVNLYIHVGGTGVAGA